MSVTLLKMKAGLSGPKFAVSPGDFRPFKDYEANRLVEAGFAQEASEAEVKAFEDEHGAIVDFVDPSDPEGPTEDETATSDATDDQTADETAASTPDTARDGKDASSEAPDGKTEQDPPAVAEFADLAAARAAYKEVFGKGPGVQWDIPTIAAKIAEKQAEG